MSTIVLLFFLATPVSAYNGMEIRLSNLIQSAEVKYDLPKGILNAVVKVESNHNYRAINSDDGTRLHKENGLKIRSYGLSQIQLGSARFIQRLKANEYGVKLVKKDLVTSKQLMIPEINVDYGAAYLKWLLDTHQNNVAWALTCYNTGPASYLCKNKKYSGTYVGKVLNAMVSSN